MSEIEILSQEEVAEWRRTCERIKGIEGVSGMREIATIEALADALVLSERARRAWENAAATGYDNLCDPDSPGDSNAAADAASADLRKKGWCSDD